MWKQRYKKFLFFNNVWTYMKSSQNTYPTFVKWKGYKSISRWGIWYFWSYSRHFWSVPYNLHYFSVRGKSEAFIQWQIFSLSKLKAFADDKKKWVTLKQKFFLGWVAHFGEKEKMLVTFFFSFSSQCFQKVSFLRVANSQDCAVKGYVSLPSARSLF